MTASADARLAETANRLITKRGRPVTIKRAETDDYDADTSEATASGTEKLGMGVLLPYPPDAIARSGGSLIETDQQLLVSPIQTNGKAMPDPAPGDEVETGGCTYTVASVRTLRPATTTMLHDLQVRA